ALASPRVAPALVGSVLAATIPVVERPAHLRGIQTRTGALTGHRIDAARLGQRLARTRAVGSDAARIAGIGTRSAALTRGTRPAFARRRQATAVHAQQPARQPWRTWGVALACTRIERAFIDRRVPAADASCINGAGLRCVRTEAAALSRRRIEPAAARLADTAVLIVANAEIGRGGTAPGPHPR